MTVLPIIAYAALLYLAFCFAADLAVMAPHLDQIIITFLSLLVGIESFSLLAYICNILRIFWLAEALLTITVPYRRLFLLVPLNYTVRLFDIESNCYVHVLQEQQKYVEALKANAFSLRSLTKRFGARSAECARELINKSFLLSRLGQSEEAADSAREAIEILKEATDKRPHNLLNLCQAMNNLGCMLITQGKSEQAIEILEESLNLARRSSPQNDHLLAMSYGNIGYTFLKGKQYAQAMRYCKQAIEVANAVPLVNEETRATFRNNLGEALRGLGKLDEADEELLASLAVRDKLLGEMHPHRAYSYHNLAKLRFDQGNLPESEQYFKKAILIREKFPGYKAADLQETIEDYCQLLEKSGHSVAAQSLKRAHKIKDSDGPA